MSDYMTRRILWYGFVNLEENECLHKKEMHLLLLIVYTIKCKRRIPSAM